MADNFIINPRPNVDYDQLVGKPNHISFSSNPNNIPQQEATLYWDVNDHTFSFLTDIPEVSQQIGQEIWVRSRNVTGNIIENGKVVYLSGAQGQRPTIAKASNNNNAHVLSTIGVATHDIEHNSFGFVTTQGLVRGINTFGMSEGLPVYLDLNGNITQVVPTNTNIVRVGWCVIAGNNGSIYVHVDRLSLTDGYINGSLTFNVSSVTFSGTSAQTFRTSLSVPGLNTTNTFADNQTFNGTNNIMPNQVASSDSSIMTRVLGDDRYSPSTLTIINESTGTRTLSTSDYDSVIRCSNATSTAITIPTNLGIPGKVIIIRRATGAGVISLTLGANVTVSDNNVSSISVGQEFALMATGTNTWDFI